MPTPRTPEDSPISSHEQALLDTIQQQLGQHTEMKATSLTTLLRFVRGWKDDPNPEHKTIQMLKQMLDWRLHNKIDELATTTLPKTETFKQMWPAGIHGVTRDGHPIFVQKLGAIDPSRLVNEFTEDEIMKFHIQQMENVMAYSARISEEKHRRIYKQFYILDLKGAGMSHFSKHFRDPIKKIVHIDGEMYPETLDHMFLTNTSFIMKAIWSCVSVFIHPITKERIHFGASDLPKYIEPSQLPRFLGGACGCVDCLVTPFVPGTSGDSTTSTVTS